MSSYRVRRERRALKREVERLKRRPVFLPVLPMASQACEQGAKLHRLAYCEAWGWEPAADMVRARLADRLTRFILPLLPEPRTRYVWMPYGGSQWEASLEVGIAVVP